MTSKPGSVVRIPFPFVDSRQSKHRPALVLSHESFQTAHHALILAMITSAHHGAWATDIPIADGKTAGLTAPSIVRFKIFTLDERLIAGALGRLGRKDWMAVQTGLRAVLSV